MITLTEYVKNAFECNLTENKFSDYKLIDLGLPSGTLWMDRNIGAKSPSDCGLYFAWGETEGYEANKAKKKFHTADYKFSNGKMDKLTKYCTKSEKGGNEFTDNLTVLKSTDDAAYKLTNGKCKMPTQKQIDELVNNTTAEKYTQDGVKGMMFTSKINGKSIFIPGSGYYFNGGVCEPNSYEGGVWSSSLEEYSPEEAYCLYFSDSDMAEAYPYDRYYGLPVRGVSK